MNYNLMIAVILGVLCFGGAGIMMLGNVYDVRKKRLNGFILGFTTTGIFLTLLWFLVLRSNP